jgi:hypothetical protein
MTDKTSEDVFKEMNLSKILVAFLETLKEVSVPMEVFLNAANEDKEMQVDFDSDSQLFTFKLKDKNE